MQESGAPVVVARHVNAGVYNNTVCICCASLAVAQGCPGTKSETHVAAREWRGNREEFRRNANDASNNVFFQTFYFLASLYESMHH